MSADPSDPRAWLARAYSNLRLAEKVQGKEVMLEDLCFNAQQAAEKALKAVCLIATWCIENDHELLHTDSDFDGYEKHLGLRVVHP